jgi:hypothetical protein
LYIKETMGLGRRAEQEQVESEQRQEPEMSPGSRATGLTGNRRAHPELFIPRIMFEDGI